MSLQPNHSAEIQNKTETKEIPTISIKGEENLSEISKEQLKIFLEKTNPDILSIEIKEDKEKEHAGFKLYVLSFLKKDGTMDKASVRSIHEFQEASQDLLQEFFKKFPEETIIMNRLEEGKDIIKNEVLQEIAKEFNIQGLEKNSIEYQQAKILAKKYNIKIMQFKNDGEVMQGFSRIKLTILTQDGKSQKFTGMYIGTNPSD